MQRTFPALLSAFALLVLPEAAWAHSMLVEAKVEATLRVVVGYEDETPAEDAKVTLAAADGRAIAEAKTDATGTCTFPRPAAGSYSLIADDGAGHRTAVPLAVPESEAEIAEARSARRNRWLMGGIGLAAIALGTVAARRLAVKTRP